MLVVVLVVVLMLLVIYMLVAVHVGARRRHCDAGATQMGEVLVRGRVLARGLRMVP